MPAEDIINWLQRTKYTGHRTPDTPAISSTSGVHILLKSNQNWLTPNFVSPFSILNSPLEQICFQVKILCRKDNISNKALHPFIISVFINAYGIAFITKALLGTSPITSVNYVLSMFTPLTMGQWTIIVNLLFVATEPLMMSRSQLRADLRMYLIQIPVTLCFGTFIDISMSSLRGFSPRPIPCSCSACSPDASFWRAA